MRNATARDVWPVLALIALGAGLRFSTLDVQSYWLDEGLTLDAVQRSFGGMLDHVRESEPNPPLYFAVAWLWAKLFGTTEVALRSLSALAGTLTIPVVYGLVARLVSRRAALVAAGLVAVNPLFVWYSQEARAYALFLLLACVSLFLFARALEAPSRSSVVWWAVVSALALATHYFVVFVVLGEAAWLVFARVGGRRAALVAAGLLAIGAALLPLLVSESDKAGGDVRWNTGVHGVAAMPKQFLLGDTASAIDNPLVGAAAVVLALAGLWLLAARAAGRERRGGLVFATLAAAALGLPLLAAILGYDFLNARNEIAAFLLLLLTMAAGFGARRAGRAGLAAGLALGLLWLGVLVAVATEPRLQREDWSAAAAELESIEPGAVIMLSPPHPFLLRHYLDGGLRWLPLRGTSTQEVVAVVVRRAPVGAVGVEVPGFREVARRREPTYEVVRLRAARPRAVSPALLKAGAPERTWAYLVVPVEAIGAHPASRVLPHS